MITGEGQADEDTQTFFIWWKVCNEVRGLAPGALYKSSMKEYRQDLVSEIMKEIRKAMIKGQNQAVEMGDLHIHPVVDTEGDEQHKKTMK